MDDAPRESKDFPKKSWERTSGLSGQPAYRLYDFVSIPVCNFCCVLMKGMRRTRKMIKFTTVNLKYYFDTSFFC